MSFVWTDEQKAQAVAGATVCVSGSPTYDAGRYTIAGRSDGNLIAMVHRETGEATGFLVVKVKGVNASVPWHRCDPSTLNVPDSKQADLFGGN